MYAHEETQKVTAHISKKLLEEAQTVTGKGITETVKMGLESIARTKAYNKLIKLRGTYDFSLDLAKLREDKKRALKQ